MKLHVFDTNTRRQWVETGYEFVKLSSSENIGFDEGNDGAFTLLEPYPPNQNVDLHSQIVGLFDSKIDRIIADGTGRYYK